MKRLLLLAALCLPVYAQTAINDTMRLIPATPTAVPWTGEIKVCWPAFTTSGGVPVARGCRNVAVNAGIISLTLFPTEGASPSFTYTADFRTMGGVNHGLAWSELWSVPTSPSIVTLKDVRQSSTLKIFPSQIIAAGLTNGTYCINVASEAATGLIACAGGPGAVSSVAGRTGDVTLAKSDVGLGNVDNTSDANKPVSTAAQAALDLKAPLASPTFTGNVAISGTVLRGGGTSLPATCTVGDQYFLTTGTTGNYQCTSTNTWSLPGSGGGTAPYSSSLYTSQTSVTISAATHGFSTAALAVMVYDNSTPRKLLAPDGTTGDGSDAITVNPTTYAVTVNFSTATTFYVVINGGVGPTGATGATGSAGSNGQSVTATAESAGANCTYGGWKFTSASGTSYVCNGAPGSGSVATTTSALKGDGAGGAVAVTGTATDCVKVDGSSGACGGGGNVTTTGTNTYTSSAINDATAAAHTLPAKAGTVANLPASCTVGEVYFATNATAGQNWYFCTTTNNWTQQLNSGAGGMSPLAPASEWIFHSYTNAQQTLVGGSGLANAGVRIIKTIYQPGLSVVYAWIYVQTIDAGKFGSLAVYNTAMNSKLCETTPFSVGTLGWVRASWASTCTLTPGLYYFVTTGDSAVAKVATISVLDPMISSGTSSNTAYAYSTTACVSTGTGASIAFNSAPSCTWNVNNAGTGLIPLLKVGN